MVRTAVQLYTLRNVDLPFADLLERVAEAGFDGVEFAYRVTEEDPAAVEQTLQDTGLDVAAAHVPIDHLESDLEETVAFYEALGCTDLVIPWLDEECFATRSALEEALDRIDAIDDRLADRDVDLHYHNHDQEFVDLDGHPALRSFVAETDVGLELDLGFVLLAGYDPVEWLELAGHRCRLAHLKDVDVAAGESVTLGEGDLALEEIAEPVRAGGGEWLIYEYEGEDPLASLPEVADRLRTLS